jgi:hypothetical protein
LCCPVCRSAVDREFVLVICKGRRLEGRVYPELLVVCELSEVVL